MEPGATQPTESEPALGLPALVGEVGSVVDTPQIPSDGEFVIRAVSGDRSAFDELVQRYQRQAIAVSYRLLGNNQDSLEVTQDAFLKAYKSLATLQKPEAFGGWFLRIVSNLSLNYRRSRKSRKQLPLDDMLGTTDSGHVETGGSEWMARSGDPARTLEGHELGQQLQAALQLLPEKQRLAILMFTVDELPQKEVAAALNCSVEAIKWHVFQGRKKLREILKDQLQD